MSVEPGLLDHALSYSARGWSILPVSGKTPVGIRSYLAYRLGAAAAMSALVIMGMVMIVGLVEVSPGLCRSDWREFAF